MLHHLAEIVLQDGGQLVDIPSLVSGQISRFEQIVELVGQLRRERREIVDEVERILDFMCDARGQLTKRGKLFRLDKTVLRDLEFSQCGLCEIARLGCLPIAAPFAPLRL